MRICIVYLVKNVASFQGLGKLMDMACNRTCTQALQTSRKKEVACNLHRNWNLFYLKYVLKFYKIL